MKFRKYISLIMVSCFSLFGLVSCDLDSIINNVISANVSYQEHEDVGTSLDILKTAFNGNRENDTDYSTLTYPELPEGAEYLEFSENIQTLEYNRNITPSVGDVKGLVIPVDFPDYPARTQTDVISKADWESVSSFYYKSSYGKLNYTFDVMDWFTLSHESSYYENLNDNYYYGDAPGVSAIINEALKYYEDKLDLNDYDSNDDDIIDSIYIIYSHPIDYDNGDFWWAYQYYYLNYSYFDRLMPYSYVFAGYDFLFEDDSKCNTHTYIHETGHLFGLEDYYDYSSDKGCNEGGLGGADLMDYTVGDHNSFSKMLLGWMKPILVDNNSYADITLMALQNLNTCIILSNNFDKSKGMFQNYFILEYYTPTNLQAHDKIYSQNGVRMFRVNAELEVKQYAENNTRVEYFKYDNSYTSYNLIDTIIDRYGRVYTNSFTSSSSNSDLFNLPLRGRLTYAHYSNGDKLNCYFTIQSQNDTSVSLKFYYLS